MSSIDVLDPIDVVDVDGIAIAEYRAAPPPLQRSEAPSSPALQPLRLSDIVVTKGRPPLIQCSSCCKWRQLDVVNLSAVATLSSRWVCPNCDVGEDVWPARSARISPYRTMALPLQKSVPAPRVKVVAPRRRKSSLLSDHQVGSVADLPRDMRWAVPLPFIRTDERKEWFYHLQSVLRERGMFIKTFPRVHATRVDLFSLYHIKQVVSSSRSPSSSDESLWEEIRSQLQSPVPALKLRTLYNRYLYVLDESDWEGTTEPDVDQATADDQAAIVDHQRAIGRARDDKGRAIDDQGRTTDDPGRTKGVKRPPEATAFEIRNETRQFAQILDTLRTRLGTLEQIVEQLVVAGQSSNTDALTAIRRRIGDLAGTVNQSGAILGDLLPQITPH